MIMAIDTGKTIYIFFICCFKKHPVFQPEHTPVIQFHCSIPTSFVPGGGFDRRLCRSSQLPLRLADLRLFRLIFRFGARQFFRGADSFVLQVLFQFGDRGFMQVFDTEGIQNAEIRDIIVAERQIFFNFGFGGDQALCPPFPAGNMQTGQNLRMFSVESMDGTELSCGKRGKNRNH